MRRCRTRTAWILAAALLPLLAAPLRAVQEEPEVRVIVDNPRPASDDIVRLTYSFTGPGVGGSLRAPAELPLKNLVVVGGPNTSTQISFMNGQLSRQASLTYFLRPSGPGPAEVGETTFKVGDKDVKAGAYLLEVGTARRSPGPGPGPGPGIAEEDPFGRMPLRGGSRRALSHRQYVGPVLAAAACCAQQRALRRRAGAQRANRPQRRLRQRGLPQPARRRPHRKAAPEGRCERSRAARSRGHGRGEAAGPA